MFLEPSQILELGFTLWENQAWVKRNAKKFARWLRHGRTRVAVFGLGGTGKTTLAKVLARELDPFSGPQPYDESLVTEDFNLPGDIACTLTVAPGQKRHARRTWPALFRSLATGKTRGVVNVVSHGFHSFGAQDEVRHYRDHRLYRRGMSARQFTTEYSAEWREKETATMRGMVDRLALAPDNLWMITLVAKQDLWWAKRKDVRRHYEKGPYNDCVKDLESRLGETRFRHEYLSASLVVSNFRTISGELLAPTSQGYDQNIQCAHLRRLYSTIIELAK